MRDPSRTKQELIDEIYVLKKRIHELEAYVSTGKEHEEYGPESGVRFGNEQIFSQLLLDTSPAFIVAIGFDGRTMMMNQALLDALGYTLEDIKEVDYLTTFVPEEDRKTLAGVFERIVREGKATVSENRIRSRSGRTYLVEWHGRPVINQGKDLDFFVGVGIDITARKRTEKALQESEEKYRALIETTNTGFVILDQDGLVLDANAEYVRLTGHQDLSEIVGRSVIEWTADYDKQKNALAVEECLQKGCIRNLQIDYVDSNGNNTPIELNAMSMVQAGWTQTLTLCRDITDRKRSDEKLTSLNQRLNDIIDFFPDATLVIDTEGKVIAWNKAMEEMTRIRASDMLGKGDYEYAMPFYGKRRPILIDLVLRPQKEIEKEYASLKREEKVLAGETYTPALGEGNMYLYATASAIKDPQGNIVGAIESLRNITDRKEMENALRESEARYKTLFGSTSDGIFILDAEAENLGKIVSANEAAANMNGYNLDELLQLRIQDLDTPDSREKVRNRMILLIAGEKLNFEVEHIRKDGSLYHVEVTANMINMSGHRYIFAIHRDISERRKAEQALAIQHEQLIAILDGIPIPTFMIDKEHCIVLWNRSNEIFTGLSKETVLGKRLDLSPLFKENAPPTLAEIILDMTDEEITRTFDSRSIRKSHIHTSAFECTGKIWLCGEERIMSIQAARIFDSKGKISGAVQTGQDITERVQLENQFRQAQKMEAIGTLAGGIAHDFNNILAAIIGYTELTIRKLQQSELNRYLEQIVTSCDRAKDLVNQILTFSRKKEQEIKPIDLAFHAEETIKLLQATLPSTISIQPTIESTGNAILADPTQIHQVIMNLCTNAAHAMRDRGGVLEIILCSTEIVPHKKSPHPDLMPGKYAKLSVTDTGTGIAPDIANRIFDPFFTTKKIGEGTGLGLSVVYGIVKDYGGAITIESRPGAGSIFHVFLPIVDHDFKIKSEVTETMPTGSERILFVDDENTLINMGRELLEDLGYNVIAVTSSIKALDIFRTHSDRFDLVITDMTMPVMMGTDLAREIWNISPETPIILCTGYNDLIDEERAKREGFRQFIQKPLRHKQLAIAVRRVLDEKKPQR